MRKQDFHKQAKTKGIYCHQISPTRNIGRTLQGLGRLYWSETCYLYHKAYNAREQINKSCIFLILRWPNRQQFLLKVLLIIMYCDCNMLISEINFKNVMRNERLWKCYKVPVLHMKWCGVI